jgi:hypothetical protein
MKVKTKKKSNYQKAVERMERETNRALAHVKLLEKMYLESKSKKNQLP